MYKHSVVCVLVPVIILSHSLVQTECHTHSVVYVRVLTHLSVFPVLLVLVLLLVRIPLEVDNIVKKDVILLWNYQYYGFFKHSQLIQLNLLYNYNYNYVTTTLLLFYYTPITILLKHLVYFTTITRLP